MPLNLGTSSAANVLLGSIQAQAVYLGSIIIWQSGFSITVTGTHNQFNVANYLSGQGITSGNVDLTLAGTFYSDNTSTAGLTVSSIPAAITLKLILASGCKLYGKGGAGASYSGGSWSSYAASNNTNSAIEGRHLRRDGFAGGTALYVRSNCLIEDQGSYIYGGGGGGGTARGHLRLNDGSTTYYKGCAGGGGGRGFSGGAGGSRETVTTTITDSGITISQSSNGSAGSSSGGGAGGKAGYVDWSLKGTNHYAFLSNGGNSKLTDGGRAGNGGSYGAAGNGFGTYDIGFFYDGIPNQFCNTNAYASGGAGGKSIDGNSYITWTGYNSANYYGSVV